MKKLVLFSLVLLIVSISFAASTTTEAVIKDGQGTTETITINKDGRLLINAVSKTKLNEASLKGDSYSWTAVSEDLAAAGTALCVANQSKTRKLVIDSVYVWSDVPTQVQVHATANYTWAGTEVTGVNLNRTSANTANAIAYTNESGNTQGSIIITKTTNELATDQFSIKCNLDGAIILDYNQAIAVDLVADSAVFKCTIVGHYID
ncbi:MAG: hypothetical protein WC441_04875 [Patescibacteria group bacterium]